MKWGRFEVNGQIKYGQVEGGVVRIIKGDMFQEYELTGEEYALTEIKILAPVMPSQVICIGKNYFKHIGEFEKNPKIPEEPIIFMVSPSSIIGPEDTIKLPYPEHETHHESELTVVIGKTCKEVSKEDASKYVFGYTCGNDVSDRVLQKKDRQWTRAKSFHTFKPVGPFIETNLDPNNLFVRCRVNGEIKQDGNSQDMLFKTDELISCISYVMTLEPGDIIMTGTPDGVGPLVSGDICEVEVQGIGILRNPVQNK